MSRVWRARSRRCRWTTRRLSIEARNYLLRQSEFDIIVCHAIDLHRSFSSREIESMAAGVPAAQFCWTTPPTQDEAPVLAQAPTPQLVGAET